MLDYHVHLWPHAERAQSSELRLERLKRYCEEAQSRGVEEIALTEHFFRFNNAVSHVGPFWERATDRDQASSIKAYFAHHATADLDAYVEAVLQAKDAGLPVILGLEVDYYKDQMDVVQQLLAGYPFDVLLGSIHWLDNAWMFDDLDSEAAMAEWDRRGIEGAWRDYTQAMEELAATNTCDVLAHPDLIKITGRFPSAGFVDECHVRMTEAAASSGMAAELSSAGWRKPVGEQYPAMSLLERFHAAGVPLTTASDAHGTGLVAHRSDELAVIANNAGYTHLRGFRGRIGYDTPIVGKTVGETAQ